MKKRIVLVMTVLLMLGNVLYVNASENLERFEKALEGTWQWVDDVEVNDIIHHNTYALGRQLVLPDDKVILTEDSNGLVYIVAYGIDEPTMGIVTLSSDNKTMVIKDTLGGCIIYNRQ